MRVYCIFMLACCASVKWWMMLNSKWAWIWSGWVVSARKNHIFHNVSICNRQRSLDKVSQCLRFDSCGAPHWSNDGRRTMVHHWHSWTKMSTSSDYLTFVAYNGCGTFRRWLRPVSSNFKQRQTAEVETKHHFWLLQTVVMRHGRAITITQKWIRVW